MKPPNNGGDRLPSPRSGMIASLVLVSVVLAIAVAVLISGVEAQLPQWGLDYHAVEIGLVTLVLAFGLYSFDRERRYRGLFEELRRAEVAEATKQVQAELLSQVMAENQTVEALFLASADGLLVVDGQGNIARSNPAMERIIGWSHAEMQDSTCRKLFACEQDGTLRCGAICPFEKVVQTSDPISDMSFPATRRDGSPTWLGGSFAAVDTREGSTRAIGSIRDINQRKEIEALQSDFVSIVSHELRGPLTAIKGFVKTLILKSDQLPEDTQVDFLETIDEQADRLNQLVEDLLNVSKIESKRLKLDMQPVDLEPLITKIVSHFHMKWEEREIVIESDPALPLVSADPKRLEEIFINLIDNAVKYSPGGGPVRVGLVAEENSVEASVEDPGVGIAPDDVPKLFSKFNRIATRETRDIGGTGLGLYIVKNLVEAQGGRIFVTSVPGVGSTFTVRFPIEARRTDATVATGR